jgi:tetratricopeptide (TPR) repeat protein
VRKEQILLVVAVTLGALLVWSASGSYTEVGAATLPAGKAVGLVEARRPDPVGGLAKEPLKGRAAWAVVRSETRPPLPPIPAPSAMPLPWVRPVTRPGPSPEHWLPLRTAIIPVPKPKDAEKEKADDSGATPAEPAGDQPAETPELFTKAKPFDPAKAAKVVQVGKDDVPVILEPTGKFKGQPDWVILEAWPDVTFEIHWLTPKTGVPFAHTPIGPAEIQGYKTVHLKPTLDNCFHEERITRGVRDDDREALIKFAAWCFTDLTKMSGEDGAQFGIGAVRKAIEVLEKAKAISADVDLIRTLGSYYRAAFDLDGVARTYLEYLKGHQTETGAQLLVGEAYERVGCWASARTLYENAAKTGDAESRLRVGLMLEREGELDKAADILKLIAGQAGVGPRANLALARIAVRNGDLKGAAACANEARKDPSASLNLVLGSILYLNGKYGEAAATFGAAKEDEVASVWRSNRGLAMLAAGELDGSAKEFQTCLDTDPLNLLDPLFGLAEAFQRKSEPDRSNAYYETALARGPADPWMLLRAGTLRLRDGQAQEALKLGLKLLEVAPGCNEGLWLVGRAYASLAEPDWEKSASYLRRVCAKEQENKDFLFEFARVLVLSGKVDEAIKVLEAATDVKSGFARTDGRLIGLLGWARFLAKRPMDEVLATISRARTAVLDDASKEWLAGVRTILDDWDNTRVWIDECNRQNSTLVGNGWEEKDGAHGINASLSGERLVFASGAVRSTPPSREAATRVYRTQDMDLGRVKEIEASLKAQMGVEFLFHIFTANTPLQERGATTASGGGRSSGRGTGGAELGLGCDRNGMMVLWLAGSSAKSQNIEIQLKDAAGNPRPWPMDEFHTVRFVRKDHQKGIWEVWFDDERIAGPDGKTTFEMSAFSRQPGKAFGMGFLVDAETGSAVNVESEYVKVTKTNK